MTADEIAAGYDLALADVYAALAYYFDHRPGLMSPSVTTTRSPTPCASAYPRS
jgi:hypothetical protein